MRIEYSSKTLLKFPTNLELKLEDMLQQYGDTLSVLPPDADGNKSYEEELKVLDEEVEELEEPTAEELELRRLNILINDPVNEEDRQICIRVQQGLHTHGYQPGPLSQQESCIFNFHEMMRDLLPVMSLPHQPDKGSVAAENSRMKSEC